MNYLLISIAVIAQFALGAVWYSPFLFGNIWMKIVGAENCTKEEIQKMQKSMMPFYLLQLLLTVIFTNFLAVFIHYTSLANVGLGAYGTALLIWFAFIVPTQISSVIWAGSKKELWLKQILIMTGNQLVGILLATFIISFN